MKLTGKCKNDFIEFLLNTDCKYSLNIEEGQLVSDAFFECPLSMQYGVFVDFFDGVGLSIGVYKIDVSKWFGIILKDNRYLNNFKEGYFTLSEARTEAVKKANEIYNAQ